MTIFKSRQVNIDPEPWIDRATGRRARAAHWIAMPGYDYLPRPEFNVTRDKRPWDASRSRPSSLGQIREWRRFASRAEGEGWGQIVEFDPRPEFDHPVNGILEEVRRWGTPPELALAQIDSWVNTKQSIPGVIDHARRVLTRLANMKESSNG